MYDEEEDETEAFAYNYAGDFPDAISIMTSAFLGGRPTQNSLGPMQQMRIVHKAAFYRAATPRRPGKGKILPRGDQEGEQEFESRKRAQKECQRLIVPKAKEEKADQYLRR